ncbi:ABC-type transport auxiliary lipoprotein family protein [Methylocella tundrae]|uniref:ABC-type transport auxiliary lipoprotein component domain-containing protein n=1 Tax=Methylocella tundrae TaxID=227605 RepID=A0A4U8Z371_METTU|nr:ABC-type transport auxiliary lipoprotein family protein [Methylocella tundrae]WPP03649.1 ABC-type transport auxiliary lipoprotein family protein [Methylocella tundrae]VFU09778.1 conserved protein of unknown function [Methylocella tundrae]
MAVACASAGFVAACASAPLATYDLGAADGGFSARRERPGQIAIYEPTALPPVDSNRIVVRMGQDQIAYLSGAKWTDQLPSLVQARLIATFQNAHIGVARLGMLADYSLRADIRRFEFDTGRMQVFVEIAAQLTASSTGRIVGGKVFSASAPAPRDDGGTVTRALDSALGDVMRQIVIWAAPRI